MCKWYDEFTGVCCNGESDYVADVCPYWDCINNMLICNREVADCYEEDIDECSVKKQT